MPAPKQIITIAAIALLTNLALEKFRAKAPGNSASGTIRRVA